MKQRQLGQSCLMVPPLCIGTNVFGWTIDEGTAFKLLDAFTDAGLTFIDTADMYSTWVPGNQGGESETIIGNWMKARGNRSRLVIATKVGQEMAPGRKGLSKAYIRTALEASLKRLQTDYVDLYQSHLDDENTPIHETLEAYDELIHAGKIRVIGASNYDAGRLQEALDISARTGLPRYQSLQPEYNLYDREGYENGLEGVCCRNGLGVLSYYSLASGFLTGKYRSEQDFGKSARGFGMSKYLNERGQRILAVLDRLAEKHNATQAQVSLAWLMARPGLTSSIASATTLEQVRELVGATAISLSMSDIDDLDFASAPAVRTQRPEPALA